MSPSEDILRLFVAIELPADVLEALASAQAELRRNGLEKLRWVRPEGIHLTLKFLGETAAPRIPAITEALATGISGHGSHELALGKLGAFGSRNSPRVLWVGVEGEVEKTRRLQASVDAALARIGFPRDERPFSPHLTLARVRPETARDVAEALAAAVASAAPPQGVIAVRELSLMQSTLGPGGAKYARLAAWELAG